jgi:hypothetical protein
MNPCNRQKKLRKGNERAEGPRPKTLNERKEKNVIRTQKRIAQWSLNQP